MSKGQEVVRLVDLVYKGKCEAFLWILDLLRPSPQLWLVLVVILLAHPVSLIYNNHGSVGKS